MKGKSKLLYSILKYFEFSHLPVRLQEVSAPICKLANDMADSLPHNEETANGLRKLLEAKDCFVRSRLENSNG